MKTQGIIATGEVQVWAIPRAQWEIERSPEDGVFEYQLRTGGCYCDGAVKVATHIVELPVPDGLDLRTMAVETIEEEITRLEDDCYRRVTALKEQISNLLTLEYIPDGQ